MKQCSVVKREYSFKSVTGLADIYARCWLPEDGKIKAVIQLTHGMAEHGDRYEQMASYLCACGYAFAANDHIGHGKSVTDDSELGYFGAEKNEGGQAFVDDAHTFTLMLKKEFAKPVILFGHSMGSFVARKYISEYSPEVTAAIICGTAGPNPTTSVAIGVAAAAVKSYGEKYPGKKLDAMAFGTFNKRCQQRTNVDWLSCDDAEVDKYVADPYCGFLFSVSGYKNLFELLRDVSADVLIARVPKSLPLYFIAGAEDPVGGYSKGVMTVIDKFIATGHTVESKIYSGMRHEIMNEINRTQVFYDVACWCDKIMAAKSQED